MTQNGGSEAANVTSRPNYVRVHLNCVPLLYPRAEGFDATEEWRRIRTGFEKCANFRILNRNHPEIPEIVGMRQVQSGDLGAEWWALQSMAPLWLQFDLPERLQKEHEFPLLPATHRPESFLAFYNGFLLMIAYWINEQSEAFDQGSVVRKYLETIIKDAAGQAPKTVGPSPLHLDVVGLAPGANSFADSAGKRLIVYNATAEATTLLLMVHEIWSDCASLLEKYYRLARARQTVDELASNCILGYSSLLARFQVFLSAPFWRPLQRIREERALYSQMTTLYSHLSRHSLTATGHTRAVDDFLADVDKNPHWRDGLPYFKENLRVRELRHDILLSGLNYVQAQAVGHGQIRMRFRAVLVGALIGGAISIIVAWLR